MTGMLLGKTVVVTGATNGIGRSIALRAAFHGARAVIVSDLDDRPRSGDPDTAQLVRNAGAAAEFVRADVTRRQDLATLVEAAQAYGGIDVMVANAGIALPGDGIDLADDAFRKLLTVNLEGVLNTFQAAATEMAALGRGGSIVLMSSMAAVRGSALAIGYGASKGGVSQLAKSLTDAVGPKGVRVNAICPGFIDTELLRATPASWQAAQDVVSKIPLRRLGQPEDVGDVVAWLGSDYSAYVSGVELSVDGGQAAVLTF